jgi:pilus assembly protein Flp/PilA
MKNMVVRFLTDQSGAIAIEYGLIALLISVVIITGVAMIGIILGGLYAVIAASTGGV